MNPLIGPDINTGDCMDFRNFLIREQWFMGWGQTNWVLKLEKDG